MHSKHQNAHLLNVKRSMKLTGLFLGMGVGCEQVVIGEEVAAGAVSTCVASSPNSQDVVDAFDVERLCPDVDFVCRVKDFVQACRPPLVVPLLPLLFVLASLPLRGIVEP